MEKEKVKFKDIFTTFKTDIQEGGKKVNADFKRDAKGAIGDFKSSENRKSSSKTGWQLFGLVLMIPLFLFGIFLLFVGGSILWDVVFGL